MYLCSRDIDVSSFYTFSIDHAGERMIMYLCARDINVPLSTPFLLTKPGERMIMYLCARDIDVSSFCTFSIDQARRENGQVFVCKRYRVILFLHLFY